jgi:hypothetical protein
MPIETNPRRWFFLAGLIAICLAIGLFTYKDYGVSWDEPSSYQYGREALSAYRLPVWGSTLPGSEPVYTDSDGLLKYYGAAYLVSGAALVKLLGLTGYSALHLLNFICFLIGVIALYILLSRWVSQPAAFGALLLFISQPLLWGHAFINPKDIPFMAFFLVSLALGLAMLDGLRLASATFHWKQLLLPALAGLVLGYATSTRIVAPLAGLIVSLLALWQSGRKSWPALGIYWMCALLGLYATWPFLWSDPVNRFIESLRTMAAFPWTNRVLFDGLYYKADNLPWRYLPKLVTFQFDEPAILLGAAGVIVLAWRARRTWRSGERKAAAYLPAILLLWFALPLTWVIFSRPTLYDNFRQFLFIMPVIFILGGLAMDAIFTHLGSPVIRSLILLAVFLPGVVAMVNLHPYEYVYYNSLAGNISNRYETDYWATSFSEAANYLDKVAPQNAVVSIGPWGLIQEFLRPDLKVDRSEVSPQSDYVIIFHRWDYEKNPGFTGKPVYSIGHAGAVYLVIQQMR